MSNDELQKAIDDITSGGAGGQIGDAGQTTVEMPDSMAAVDLGAPSAPPLNIPDMAAMPEMPAPAPAPEMGGINIPVPEVPAMPEVPKMPEAAPIASAMPSVAPNMPEATNSSEAVAGETDKVVSPDMEELKKDALLQLYPLLEGMNIGAKQRFDVCMKVVEKTGEKDALKVALNATREMADPNEKGAALMKIIEKIDTI